MYVIGSTSESQTMNKWQQGGSLPGASHATRVRRVILLTASMATIALVARIATVIAVALAILCIMRILGIKFCEMLR